jgi:hypothetical protein
MSTRILSSPGVQITEIDNTILARSRAGTNVFMTGFTKQGPTDERIEVGSISEYEGIFGLPTNDAERYLYHSARQVLLSRGNLSVTRLPYGGDLGVGFSNSYNALVYPVKGFLTISNGASSLTLPGSGAAMVGDFAAAFGGGYSNSLLSALVSLSSYNTSNKITFSVNTDTFATGSPLTSAWYQLLSNNFSSSESLSGRVVAAELYYSPKSYEDSNYFEIRAPKSILLSADEYNDLISNDVTWNPSYTAVDINTASSIKYGGIIVLNNSKLGVNSLYEGYYVGLCDNSDVNPATAFNALTGIKAVNGIINNSQTFVSVPSSRLNFKLSSESSYTGGSISQLIEQHPINYDFASPSFNDSLVLMQVKVRASIYAQDTVTLDYSKQVAYTGSLYYHRTQNNPNGGAPITFSLEKSANSNTGDVKIIVNPYISNTGTWTDVGGNPSKVVRLHPEVKNLYSQGVYVSETDISASDLGNVPAKLQRVLTKLDDLDSDIDILAEAGLGTIWAQAKAKKEAYTEIYSNNDVLKNGYFYDETYPISVSKLAALKQQEVAGIDSTLKNDYQAIVTQLHQFAQETRKDHIFIADPLRCIFVNGPDNKVVKRTDFVFSTDIYWSLRNLFAGITTSYGCSYGNWIKSNDTASNLQVWLPSSGYVAAVMGNSTAGGYPWSAPAGFSRGVLSGVIDIAINPTQKQRDLLYRININPIAFFPGDGYAVYGQKTLFSKPSAFDRINVRRLFLYLEKVTKDALKYFVFEPNTLSTRLRLRDALNPEFAKAKNYDGVYDYRIICDERNNTPDVIDNNELKVAIYIQPVRTAEFILADFIATRTGVNFNEIIS